MEIKVCGMRDPENIRKLITEVAPNWMGLIFYPKSPRFVPDKLAPEISMTDVPKVGVFVNQSVEEIVDKAENFKLSAIQLHGAEPVEFVEELAGKVDAEVWKVISVDQNISWTNLEGYIPFVSKFLFDTATPAFGGSGRKFDWNVLETYPFDKGFLLSGGLDGDSAGEILDLARRVGQLQGVDLNSKFEDAPGFKNIEKLKDFKQRLIHSEAGNH